MNPKISKLNAVIGIVVLNIIAFSFWQLSGPPPQSRDFVQSDATVIDSGIWQVSKVPDGWYPKVTYRYVVEGQPYTSDRYAVVTSSLDKEEAEKIAVQFSKGENIKVWYKRDQPEHAVITTELSSVGAFIYVITILVWLGGNAFLGWQLLSLTVPSTGPRPRSRGPSAG